MQIMNIRLKFTKENDVKYISHLDLMRTFQRAIRRADIPIAYSKGFNPHQEISFGAPLALGTTSTAEYTDINVAEGTELKNLIESLNSNMPSGIRILDGIELPGNAKNAMSLVTHSRYTLRLIIKDITLEELNTHLINFMQQENIKVMKEQPKKGFELKEVDIRPMIVSINALSVEDSECYVSCLLLSGSKANLKPELLITGLRAFTGLEINGVKIHREEVYTEFDGKLVDLIEINK